MTSIDAERVLKRIDAIILIDPIYPQLKSLKDDIMDGIYDTPTDRVEQNPDGYFIISRVHRDDVASVFTDDDLSDEENEAIEKRAANLSDFDMMELASDMEDDYHNQLYWSQIEILAEDMMKPRDEEEE